MPVSRQRRTRFMSFVRRWRWLFRGALLMVMGVASAVGWNLATGNFATVIRDQVYRSAQLRPVDLGTRVAENKVRTVLNLRGHHPETEWYRGERAQTLAH